MPIFHKLVDALASDFKVKWWSFLIAIPGFLILRYLVFGTRAEFAVFFENTKSILLPLAIGLAALSLIVALASRSRSGGTIKLANALFWMNTIALVTAIVAVTVYTKLQFK